jgi:hypothetical protein
MIVLLFYFISFNNAWLECNLAGKDIQHLMFVSYYMQIAKNDGQTREVSYICVEKPIGDWAFCEPCNPFNENREHLNNWFGFGFISMIFFCPIVWLVVFCCRSVGSDIIEEFKKKCAEQKLREDPKKTDTEIGQKTNGTKINYCTV